MFRLAIIIVCVWLAILILLSFKTSNDVALTIYPESIDNDLETTINPLGTHVELDETERDIINNIIMLDINNSPPGTKSFVDITVDFNDINENNIIDQGDVWADVLNDNPQSSVWISGISDNILAVVEYILFTYPSVDAKRINVVLARSENVINTSLYKNLEEHVTMIIAPSRDEIDFIIEENMQ